MKLSILCDPPDTVFFPTASCPDQIFIILHKKRSKDCSYKTIDSSVDISNSLAREEYIIKSIQLLNRQTRNHDLVARHLSHLFPVIF